MSKTIVNNQDCTVKQPTQFNAEELARLQDVACQQWLAAPGNTTFLVTETSFMIACQRIVELTQQGYEHVTHGHHLTMPYVVPFKKKQEEIDVELEKVRADVEHTYKAKISKEVNQAKENLIAQRKATLERKEKEKAEQNEQRLLAELQEEANALFDSYLNFNTAD
ncbi:hypothetical protein SAMN03159475_4791 [Pseudomonas sp. NFPP33]|nr:hypothetical protein [Pseudomonas sp. NFPP33]SDA83168.1 hypothetical protein SAMN03159475_4791 [Pseudomonas sp. NFPP33]